MTNVTAFSLAQRYREAVIKEESAKGKDHPLIQWWLSLCNLGLHMPDETAWCSAFVNGIAWELRLPRTKNAAARSWLAVGRSVALELATADWCVVILQRGAGAQPGPEVRYPDGSWPPGHVGFFAGYEPARGTTPALVHVLGGNQGNEVSIAPFPADRVLGVRMLTA